jgi:hypothetical protein
MVVAKQIQGRWHIFEGYVKLTAISFGSQQRAEQWIEQRFLDNEVKNKVKNLRPIAEYSNKGYLSLMGS